MEDENNFPVNENINSVGQFRVLSETILFELWSDNLQILSDNFRRIESNINPLSMYVCEGQFWSDNLKKKRSEKIWMT